MAANMGMYKDPGYDALKDFRHVMRLTSSDIVLIVPAESVTPALPELTARMRAAPGQLNYASRGVGTPSHLGVELLLSAQHVQATHVPYKGASELVNAVLGKQVFRHAYLWRGVPADPGGQAQGHRHRHRRSAAQPLAARCADAGGARLRGVDLTFWGGISVPAATPDPIVARISAAFEKALQQPGLRAQLQANGGNVRPSANAQEYVQTS
jgi:tripartite-type tricarboxylate transporter receptor subunit TctC